MAKLPALLRRRSVLCAAVISAAGIAAAVQATAARVSFDVSMLTGESPAEIKPEDIKEVPAKPHMEKCYGVVKAYKNDCASRAHRHSCAAKAVKDGDVDEYVEVPTGLCVNLIGGALQPKNPGT
jgi:uncharacterized membrane protein